MRIRVGLESESQPQTVSKTRSERAIAQPRDRFGRFAKYSTLMVVDEFGNIGQTPHKGEEFFGYGVTVTRDPEAFASATDDNRFYHSGEWKARDDTISNRTKITRRIAGTNPKTYGYYIDKRNPPKEWSEEDREELMTRIMRYSVKSTLPETGKGDVYVVVDNHRAYHSNTRETIESTSTPWKRVTGDQFNSGEGEFADVLQSHDYVANAIRSYLLLGDDTRIKILKTRIHEIEDGEIDG